MWKCTNDGIAKSQEPRDKRKEKREKRKEKRVKRKEKREVNL